MFTEDRTGQSLGGPTSSTLENATMVHDSASFIGRQATTPSSVQCAVGTTPQQCSSSPETSNAIDCMQSLRTTIQQRGISGKAAEIILRSWSEGTHKQYEPYIKRWTDFCNKREINSFDPSVTSVLDFLTAQHEKGLAHTTLNTARSAISVFTIPKDNCSIGSHPIVTRFMKGVYKSTPPTPRYKTTWDVQVVLSYLSSFPNVSDLPVKLLTLKTIMLLALVTAQRGQSLHMLDMEFMTEFPDRFEFVLPEHVKQSRPGDEPPSIIVKAYPADQSLCAFAHMKEYLKRTKPLRGSETGVFITLVKPYKHVSRDTISRWIRSVMKDAGIDVTQFKPHSTRAASTSKAKAAAVPLQEILNTAGWSSSRCFDRYYNTPVQTNSFSEAVLSAK